MSRPIQIGRRYTEWWFLAPLVIAVGLVAAGTMLLIVAHPGGRATLVAGGLAAFLAVISAIRIARSRFEIEVTPGGFVVRNRQSETEYLDDQVICATLICQPVLLQRRLERDDADDFRRLGRERVERRGK